MTVYKPADLVSTSPYAGIRPKLRYRKITPESFELFGRPVKPGQFIQAYPEEIEHIKHHFECTDTEEMQKLAMVKEEVVEERIEEVVEGKKRIRKVRTTRTIPKVEHLYIVKQIGKSEKYNVINTTTKKPLNEHKLTLEEATKLKETLNM